jgi:branched-chain amino acid transport system permease protein
MSFSIFLQVLIGGLVLGSIYALVAFGLSLVYGVVRILNFSHGTVLVASAIAASVLFGAYAFNPLVITLLLIPPLMVLGYGFYVLLLDPLFRRSSAEMTVGTVLVTVGALLILSDLAAVLAGTSIRGIQVEGPIFVIGDVIVSATNLAIMLGIALLVFVIHYILRHTWLGCAIRAVTQDELGARICGVRSRTIRAATFAFSYAVVAVAAVLYAMSYPVDPYVGLSLTVKAFTVIVLGGIGNLPGSLAAGLFLGTAEAFTAFFAGTAWAPAVSILLLLVILVLLPRGALNRKWWRKWQTG